MSSGPGSQPENSAPGKADALFARFLEASPAGDGFDELVSQNPAHAAALGALHSLWLAGVAVQPDEADRGGTTGELPAAPRALQALAGVSGPQGPPSIPGYQLGEILGEGGFGVVYRAEQERPIRRTVAIKVIRSGMVTREVAARFDTERQALALMSHASIARVFDAGTTPRGQPYFVMEHIQGAPITEHCERAGLGVDDRLGLFLEVCDAVEHAHQKGVIHRDLKPSNVLVSTEGGRPLPKVIDFGIAKALGVQLTEHTMQTEMGQVIGTPAYMSPEQADLTGTDIDTRTDIYSLGALLYEVLTGLQPFEPDRLRQKSLIEILRFVREEEPGRPSTRVGAGHQGLSRRLRGDLDWIVLKAMAKDRGRRYAAVSELAADLRRHLRHEPVLAGPPSALYRLSKLARKHRTAVSVAAALILVAASAGAFFLYESARNLSNRIDAARQAIGQRDMDRAKALVAGLLESHFGNRSVRELEVAVSALDLDVRSTESANRLSSAARDWARQIQSRESARELRHAWEKQRVTLPTSAPPWERGAELEVYDKWEAAQREAQDLYDSAASAFQRAVDIAPPGSEAERKSRNAFALVHQDLQRFADQEGTLSFGAEFFRRRGTELDPAVFARRGGSIRVRTHPAQADVYCFRYEEHEKRLLPLPFDPRAGATRASDGLLRGPSLVVERVFEPTRCPFVPGDRLLVVNGKELSLQGDLARALAGVADDASIKASVERAGGKTEIQWTPFPAAVSEKLPPELRVEPRRLVSFRRQLGFDIAGYPLDLLDGCRLGRTDGSAPLEAHLPDGSYLLVCRKDGYLESRFPVRIVDKDSDVDVRLLLLDEMPLDFLQVPAGSFRPGGDLQDAFQPLPQDEVFVEDFLIARYEVRFAEYLEFLNDPLSPIDDDGEGLPALAPLRERLKALFEQRAIAKEAMSFLPRTDRNESYLERSPEGRWQLPERAAGAGMPVQGVSQWAAQEYAHWLTERRCPGGVVRYRLPTDVEWEKAARGADRRLFVWGDYPLWSYAWTSRGIYLRRKLTEDVGFIPTDESVYGVRDLTGSVSEHAIGQPSPPYPYASLRGGNYFNTDENFGRTATRNGLYPWNRAQSTGFRLVAELKKAP